MYGPCKAVHTCIAIRNNTMYIQFLKQRVWETLQYYWYDQNSQGQPLFRSGYLLYLYSKCRYAICHIIGIVDATHEEAILIFRSCNG